ncbi:helix-turn-helix transcriptional regulator [Promicromonospora sp. NPDC057138]|uniref:helix-turn-helix transcriptional regulator n=1 Tax=Promicromonospora sp. NPDC057138 TaxID=3346031 RepID=UPI00362A1984
MGMGDQIRQRRIELGWSQDRLAAEVCRVAGVEINALGRQEIYRWEKGKRTPREWLPFIAKAVGLAQEELAAPEVPVAYGVSLRGIWHSHYTYESTGRGPITRHHHVVIRQEGNRLSAESLRESNDSPVSLSVTMRGPIGTGTWTEHTAVDGYYQGAVYHGALQVIVDPTGRTMTGKWVGFDTEFRVDAGSWTLDLVDTATDEATLERYSRSPVEPDAV